MTLPPRTGVRTRGDVLITGATGFLGMELLARLLEDGDRRVWALVRAANQPEAERRVRATLASLVGDPDAVADRVVPVAGDLMRDGLGLEPRRRDELAERVGEVIHSAASVSFSLPLEQARAVNVQGTRRMLELATLVSARGAGLGRFAHVSTAYVAGTHRGSFVDRAAELVGRPPVRALPPRLYRHLVHPLLLRRAGPQQRRWLERGEVFFPYLATRARFDTRATRAALDEAGIEEVPPLASYLDRLLEFAERAEWGKRPLSRSTVSTPGLGGADEREVDSGADPGPERSHRGGHRRQQRVGTGHGARARAGGSARGARLPQHPEG